MKATRNEIERYMAVLGETVGRFESAVSGLKTADIQEFGSGTGSWSINEILAHLRACTDIWGEDIYQMLAGDEPVQRYLSPRTYMKRVKYHLIDFETSFEIFKAEREAFLGLLSGLTFEKWERGAVMRGRRQTIFSHVRRMALHEEGHWGQLDGLRKGALMRED